MEVLTILSAVALLGLVIAIWCFADPSRHLSAVLALIITSLAAGLTVAVHFVQLTAIRQLWRAGRLADYRLIWPSPLFAVEYLVWDFLIGLTLVFLSFALTETPGAVRTRRALLLAGVLCLVGGAGPVTGRMPLQNIAVLGYAVVLPIAGALATSMFRGALPSARAAA
jgi:hypothetical protein